MFRLKKSIVYKLHIYNKGDEGRMPDDLKEIMRTRLKNLTEAGDEVIEPSPVVEEEQIPDSGITPAEPEVPVEEEVKKPKKPRKPKKVKE